MNAFDDIREFITAKKFDLIFWSVLLLSLIVVVILFFRIEHITLAAKPGEIVTVSNVPSVGVIEVTLGGRGVTVDYQSMRNSDFTDYWCEEDIVIFNEDFSPNDDITVKNDCCETLTIEVYSYAFRVLNGILDASNGGLIEGYEESPRDD